MTAAEFRIAQDRLGVTEEWLADELDVQRRAVARWKSGERVITEARATEIRQMIAATETFIAHVVAELTLADEDERWVITYQSDDAYRAVHPHTTWPAGWHRAAMGRAAERVPGTRVRYFTDAEEQVCDE